ncbi:ead/Ea22-like family protein [Escherichia coli]|uniref:ead/Ea22-like family protein n=1 Tax=Enterobacteriaceae TaxID=543 RepID=UPI0003BD1FB7|nr:MULTISPECIES: ead/Ea22-like family protein [Enterobacteriaceae]EDY0642935.1 ead/Ea22-like family protein [Salmonella enterica subsp. enterica]EEW1916571.1 ead/Ea22-like family protein [Escherichia coli]EEW2177615.1 ead/Ea22-like family protein [Escherichia coli]EFH4696666.1 ead/Ea22-like family protein [Escherichia coli]EFH5039644.1 ead/Ea22-like family protein [Escherichia coli]
MSNIDKRGLREAAEKATKGRWAVEFDDEIYSTDGVNHEQIAMVFSENEARDAAFIAAANPATVLAMLDELESAEKRIAELEGGAFNPAILDVVAERQRQKTIEGWTPEHDDEHCNGELAMAAVCYINETGTVNRNGGKPWGWPWDASWWKPNARRRNLVKAGALILAEIERIDRAAGIGKGE